MSPTTPRRRRDPVRIAGWWLRWALVPALLGVFVSGNIDVRSLPLFGSERLTAVLLNDGQAYFGHLDDSGENGWLVLRDVYYLQDAKGVPTNIAVALARRGGEAHEPADGMTINRDRVLAVERVRPDSAVARAIAVEREMLGVRSSFSLNPQTVADSSDLGRQRTAAEHAIARGLIAQASTLTKINTELVLPVSKAEADAITKKAMTDLHQVRLSALASLGAAIGMRDADAQAYARSADPALEGQTFADDPPVLLAPDLGAVVARATALFAQVGDAAAKQLTQPRASASPSPSVQPARSASPSATPSPRP